MTEHDLKTCVCADCCATRGARRVDAVKVNGKTRSGDGAAVLLAAVVVLVLGVLWWSSVGGGGGAPSPGETSVQQHYPDRKCRYPGGVVDVVRDVPLADWEQACAANGGVPAR